MRVFVSLCLLLVATPAAALAQSAQATLTGRVVDTSDAAVPNVTVEVMQIETNQATRVVTNAVGMTAGAAVLLVAAAVAGESFALPTVGETQLAVLYLVAATVGLFLLVLYVVQRWTASATAYVFVLMPIVALAVGALIADEEITATTILGGAVVCAGVYLGALSRRG